MASSLPQPIRPKLPINKFTSVIFMHLVWCLLCWVRFVYKLTWVDLQFLASPTTWVELSWTFHQALELSWAKILYIWPRLDLIQVEPTNSSQLRVDQKLKKINFFQVNSRKNWKKLELHEMGIFCSFYEVNFKSFYVNWNII